MSSPFERNSAASRIYANAQLPRNLMGGVEAMRNASLGAMLGNPSANVSTWSYLPRWPLETVEAWRERVASTFLEPYYSGAWQSLVGKAFGEGITLSDDVPEPIVEMWENIDYSGTHGDVFAQWVFGDTLHVGVGHVLVEYPQADGLQTVADEREAGVRPYWVYIPGDAVLGWRFETENGQRRLTQFRFAETTVEPDGEFGEKEVKRARVYYAADAENPWARYEVYRETGGRNGKAEIESQGFLRPHTEIPLASFSPLGVKWEEAKPFLHELAWLNLEAWQSGSDQRNLLHFARVPFFFFKSFTEKEIEAFRGVGGAARAAASDPSADIKVVEGSGAAMGEGWRDLDRIRSAAQALSLRPLDQSIVPQTATAVLREQGAALSPLEFASRCFQDTIEKALGFTAQWLGLPVEAGGSVTMAEELGGSQAEGERATIILSAYNAQPPLISAKTARKELHSLGVFSDDFDPEGEAALLELEGNGSKADDSQDDFADDDEDMKPEPGAQPEPEVEDEGEARGAQAA